MPEPVLGRGRGRRRSPVPINSNKHLTPVVSSATSDLSLSPNSSIRDDDRSEYGFSSASSGSPLLATSSSTVPKGRGRGGERLKQKLSPENPYWTVTNLTNSQFYSNTRPLKPDELGILGDQIQVIANYFPILQYPHQGLVYRYHIQIRNRKNLETHRDLRR
jgi:hypothetical protein